MTNLYKKDWPGNFWAQLIVPVCLFSLSCVHDRQTYDGLIWQSRVSEKNYFKVNVTNWFVCILNEVSCVFFSRPEQVVYINFNTYTVWYYGLSKNSLFETFMLNTQVVEIAAFYRNDVLKYSAPTQCRSNYSYDEKV